MGLREMKAERTRAQIADAALTAFIGKGYDQTTMEQIAEIAEVSPSTLYRYFPTKEQLILASYTDVVDLGRYLRARPTDEPAAEALAAALLDLGDAYADPARRMPEVRRILDASPVPRARLWDVLQQSRAGLEAALAERMGMDPADHSVQVSAGIALDIFYRVDELWKNGRREDYRILFRDALVSLSAATIVLPTLA